MKNKIIQHLNDYHLIEIIESPSPPALNIVMAPEASSHKAYTSVVHKSFQEVLNGRHSSRCLKKIDISSFLPVLYESTRVKETEFTNTLYYKSSRPYPSAGGRHPLEIICICKGVVGLADGIWYFNPYTASLVMTTIPPQFAQKLEHKAKQLIDIDEVPILVLTVAVLNRTLSRYKNGLSLVWRDTGGLLTTMSLVCTSLNLNSCQIGISEEFEFGATLGLSEEPLWITGALALGR